MVKSKPIHKPSLPFPQLTQSYLIKPSNITLIYRTLRGQSPWCNQQYRLWTNDPVYSKHRLQGKREKQEGERDRQRDRENL